MRNNALDFGMTEEQFWLSTLGEIQRFFDSQERIYKMRAKETANNEYTLALLIGNAIGCSLSQDAKFPTLEECFPTLFEEEIKQQEQVNNKDKAFFANLLAYSEFNNKKFKKGDDE